MGKELKRYISFLHIINRDWLLHSLRAKIILGVSLILILTIGGFTYISAVTQTRFHLKKQEERAFDISDVVLKGIEYPMLDGAMDDVQAILQRLWGLEGLEEVNLCDLTGKVKYSGNTENIGKIFITEITRNALNNKKLLKGLEVYKEKKLLFHAIPIYNEAACFKCHGREKDILGVLTVGIDWGPIEKKIGELRNREIIVALISLIVVGFFLIRWLSKYVTYPISRITEFANEVSLGKFDAKLDLGKKTKPWGTDKLYSGDEIAQLSDSLIRMLKSMTKMYQKISSFNKDLELQVAKRTEELENKTAELEHANRELKKLDELRSAFLANMSHELRTPLNSIIGYTDLLLDGVDGDINEEQDTSLTKVHNNAKNLLKLINHILDMSRIESGKMEIHLGEVDLQDIIERVVSSLSPLINKKNLTVKMKFEDSLPFVYADPDMVRQIITNLLDNAVKFTSEGYITLSAGSSGAGVESNQPAEFIEVCISDTGTGIKEEDFVELFNMFRPLDLSATRPHGGVGLGLSICKRLVEMLNGNIWVKSKHGEGSKFYFTLPVYKNG